jgi:hypothetical protein
MQTIGKIALGLAVAAFFGAAATPVLASPVWQTCTNLEAKIGSYEDAKCTKEKAEGDYEWLEVAGTEKVTSSGTLTLEDTSLGVTVEVQCSGNNSGSVGPERSGRIEAITNIKCNAGKNCEKVTKNTEPVHLPWRTELSETEGKIRDTITSAGSGAPGWRVTCKVALLGEVTDECTGEKGYTVLENVSGEVNSIFGTGKINCTFTGAETGEIIGTVRTEGSSGKGLRGVPKPLFRAENPANTKIELRAEQETTSDIEVKLDQNEGKISCTKGVTFAAQKLVAPTPVLDFVPTFPANCEAEINSAKMEAVTVGSCPKIEIRSDTNQVGFEKCEFKIKIPKQAELCVVKVIAQTISPSVTYLNKGVKPTNIRADIHSPALLNYETNKCGIAGGSAGAFLGKLVLKGFEPEKTETQVGVVVK